MADNDDEPADFPVVCSTCLGPNPYVRMQKIPGGGQCHVSGRPYTVWRWRPGADARYKKTVICPEVARARHVCQVCLLDLDYGVPVQVRDALLTGATGQEDGAPRSAVGVEFALNEQERRGLLGAVPAAGQPGGAGYGLLTAAGAGAGAGGAGGGALAVPGGAGGADGSGETGAGAMIAPGSAAAVRELERLRDRRPNYERNRARVCTFFVRGECTRGASCPYRHEMPKASHLEHQQGNRTQSMRDRYYGSNDPAAARMLSRAAERNGPGSSRPPPEPPADRSVTTLFVGGLDAVAPGQPPVGEDDLRGVFWPHGEIEGVRVPPGRGIAFVTFSTREGAERAVGALHASLEVRGARLRLSWATGGPAPGGGRGGGGRAPYDPMLPSSAYAAPPPPGYGGYRHPHPPGYGPPAAAAGAASYYPSMDPSAMGSASAAPVAGGGGGGGGGVGGGGAGQQQQQQRQQGQRRPPQQQQEKRAAAGTAAAATGADKAGEGGGGAAAAAGDGAGKKRAAAPADNNKEAGGGDKPAAEEKEETPKRPRRAR